MCALFAMEGWLCPPQIKQSLSANSGTPLAPLTHLYPPFHSPLRAICVVKPPTGEFYGEGSIRGYLLRKPGWAARCLAGRRSRRGTVRWRWPDPPAGMPSRRCVASAASGHKEKLPPQSRGPYEKPTKHFYRPLKTFLCRFELKNTTQRIQQNHNQIKRQHHISATKDSWEKTVLFQGNSKTLET